MPAGFRVKFDSFLGLDLITTLSRRTAPAQHPQSWVVGPVLAVDHEIPMDGVDTAAGLGGALDYLNISATNGKAKATLLGLGVDGPGSDLPTIGGSERLSFGLDQRQLDRFGGVPDQVIAHASFDLTAVVGRGEVVAELYLGGTKVGEQVFTLHRAGRIEVEANGRDFDEVRLGAQSGGVQFLVKGAAFDTQPANAAPIVLNAVATTLEDTAIDLGILASDPEGQPLTFINPPASASGQFEQHPDGHWFFTPNADFNGTIETSYTVSDGQHTTIGQIHLTVSPVNDAPVVAQPASATTPEDTVVSGQVLATDVDGDALTYSIGTADGPQNGTASIDAAGQWTYAPAGDYNGPDSFVVTVSDGTTAVQQTVSLAVTAVNDAPVVVQPAPVTTPEDTAVSGQVLATDVDGDALTYSIGTADGPQNGTASIDAAGQWTYAPAGDYNGPDSFVVTVSDGTTAVQQTVSLAVTAVNDAPVVVQPAPVTTPEDTAVSGQVLATDVDGDALTYSIGTADGPQNGTASIDAAGQWTYAPAPDYNGPDSFVVTVSDGTTAVQQTVSLAVTAVNDAPVVVQPAPVTTPEDTAVSGQVLATDVDGDALTYSIGTADGPQNGTASIDAAGQWTYAPAPDYNGPDSFVVTVSDGTTAVQQTVSLAVTAVNDAPVVVQPAPVTTPEDTAVSGQVLATDVDGDALTYSIGTADGPQNGTASIDAAGQWTYAPAGDYNGPDSFVVTVSDGTTAVQQTVSLAVTAVNDAPVVVQPAPVTTPEDTAVSGQVLATDVDGDALTYSIGTADGPQNGTASIDAAGQWTYAPAPDYNGPDSFVVTVSDGTTAVQQTVSLAVTAVNDAPVYTVAVTPETVAEGDMGAGNTITFTVIRSGDVGQASTVVVALGGAAVENEDYTVSNHLKNGVVSFAVGDAMASFTITTNPDTVFETDETVIATLGVVSGDGTLGDQVSATATITNDDAIGMVSISTAGNQGNSDSTASSISADGRFVVFQSSANNLVAGDLNGTVRDVFVRDLQGGATKLISVNTAGFPGYSDSIGPSISADGRYVTFWSYASNLVTGDTNGAADVFVRDLDTGTTTLVSAGGNHESYVPSISADGRYVTFYSYASNLVTGDTNGTADVFVRDLDTGTTTLVSAGGNSESYDPAISADGRYVTFWSYASNLVTGDTNGAADVFVRDLDTGTTTLVSAGGNHESYVPSISADGRYVTFYSYASNLVTGDTNGTADVFVRDLDTGTTTLVSAGGNGESYDPAISADGRYVTFRSAASNLVTGDTNGTWDVFVRDLDTGTTTLVSAGGNGESYAPAISADGRYVTFQSLASNLVAGDTSGTWDVFVVDGLAQGWWLA